jgi:hypothetical protein
LFTARWPRAIRELLLLVLGLLLGAYARCSELVMRPGTMVRIDTAILCDPAASIGLDVVPASPRSDRVGYRGGASPASIVLGAGSEAAPPQMLRGCVFNAIHDGIISSHHD